MRPCKKCGATDRYANGNCRPCHVTAERARRADPDVRTRINVARRVRSADPEARARRSAQDRARRTGWSKEEFNRAWATQKGRCSICSCAMTMGDKVRKSYSVTADHSHYTGRPRGLLCNLCNVHLAAIEDLGWKHKAEAYLRCYP